MPLATPPTIPLITDPSTFATRAQDWVVWQSDELYPFLVSSSGLLGLSTSATSTTSNIVGTGSKSFTVQTGKGFVEGQSLSIARTSATTNRMFAVVTSYNSGTGALVVNSQAFEGSGTFTDWSIALAFNGVVSPAQLSTGAPTWNTAGQFTVVLPSLLGYGTGAGGSVTQLTSKATNVTLNKPTGQIVTNNAALAAGASVNFALNNTLINTTDGVIANVLGGAGAYTVQVVNVGVAGGSVTFRLTNISGGSLSEAVTINFDIIKGVNS
ncbi:MAG: hypothetical protein V4570_01935 [Pseudomonadota bacterium]